MADVWKSLDKLERRLRKSGDSDEEARLNRQIGLGRMLLAFDCEDGHSAASSISRDMLEWSEDLDKEHRLQVGLLRQIVPDASRSVDPKE